MLAAVADHLIPAAHGMPSAAEVVTDDRLRFVLTRAAGPRRAAPGRAPVRARRRRRRERLATLAADDPAALGALQLAIVAGYYTDKRVRELIGYPGQEAITVRSWELPALSRGRPDRRRARAWPGLAGPGDRATGRRSECTTDLPERYAAAEAAAEGGHDGHDGA